MGERRRDAVDMLVGQNIRILRQDRRMSQTELGRKIDVTFQQVQKYENGTNRVGSGRLFKIASSLDVPITAFFEGAHQTASGDAATIARRHAGGALCPAVAAGVLRDREHGFAALARRARRKHRGRASLSAHGRRRQ